MRRCLSAAIFLCNFCKWPFTYFGMGAYLHVLQTIILYCGKWWNTSWKSSMVRLGNAMHELPFNCYYLILLLFLSSLSLLWHGSTPLSFRCEVGLVRLNPITTVCLLRTSTLRRLQAITTLISNHFRLRLSKTLQWSLDTCIF